MENKRARRAVVVVATLLAGGIVGSWSGGTAQAAPFNFRHLNKIQQRLVSGALAGYLAPPGRGGFGPNAQPRGGDDEGPGADGLPNTPPSAFTQDGSGGVGNYQPTGAGQCAVRLGSNVKVNQNCLNITDEDLQGRGQANNETAIAQDPYHPSRLVASDNDYVRGDGTCGASYSRDHGRTWNDSTVPNTFSRGLDPKVARQYWEAGGDTSVAWDTRGNAYLSCQVFNRGVPTTQNPDQSSAFLVFRSTGNGGASWNFPGRYVTSFFDPTGTGNVLEDKQLLTVDNNTRSPFRDRVYVTWTLFAADGTGYIYESYSSDYGETFSAPTVVSTDSALCANTYGVPTPHGRCNENQDSDPFVGPDGALYVVWSNFNNAVTGDDNRNQMLLAKSTDGGSTFGAPVKVGDYYDLPDCATYQGDDAGRACVPEKGKSTRSVFRATNYPSGSVNPRHPNQIAVTYGSYINRNSTEKNGCTPTGFSKYGANTFRGVKTPGACNNDILVSRSSDAGATFTGTSADPRVMPSVTNGSHQRTTDQFFQWSTFTQTGRLAVSYYDRQYGSDEFTGSSDVSLSGSRDVRHFRTTRVTSSSMPAPTQFYGVNGGVFYGDYITLTAVGNVAHPVWSDTRSKDLFLCPGTATGPGNPPRVCSGTEPNGQVANDQNMFTDTVRIPGAAHHHD